MLFGFKIKKVLNFLRIKKGKSVEFFDYNKSNLRLDEININTFPITNF